MANPETEPIQQPEVNGQVESRPEDIAIPEHIEHATGVQATPSQATGLTDDQNQITVQAVPNPDPTAIQLPAEPHTAQTWSSGSPEDASTWLGVFVLRKVKQAIALGRKIIVGGS